jgi:hypothetical protein
MLLRCGCCRGCARSCRRRGCSCRLLCHQCCVRARRLRACVCKHVGAGTQAGRLHQAHRKQGGITTASRERGVPCAARRGEISTRYHKRRRTIFRRRWNAQDILPQDVHARARAPLAAVVHVACYGACMRGAHARAVRAKPYDIVPAHLRSGQVAIGTALTLNIGLDHMHTPAGARAQGAVCSRKAGSLNLASLCVVVNNSFSTSECVSETLLSRRCAVRDRCSGLQRRTTRLTLLSHLRDTDSAVLWGLLSLGSGAKFIKHHLPARRHSRPPNQSTSRWREQPPRAACVGCAGRGHCADAPGWPLACCGTT